MVEFVEALTVVLAVGSVRGRGLLIPATAGALAARAVVVALGAAIHRPLARVPDNALKFSVGVLLSAFGCFWMGEGIGLDWLGADWSVLALVVGFLGVALAAVALCRGAVRA